MTPLMSLRILPAQLFNSLVDRKIKRFFFSPSIVRLLKADQSVVRIKWGVFTYVGDSTIRKRRIEKKFSSTIELRDTNCEILFQIKDQ